MSLPGKSSRDSDLQSLRQIINGRGWSTLAAYLAHIVETDCFDGELSAQIDELRKTPEVHKNPFMGMFDFSGPKTEPAPSKTVRVKKFRK